MHECLAWESSETRNRANAGKRPQLNRHGKGKRRPQSADYLSATSASHGICRESATPTEITNAMRSDVERCTQPHTSYPSGRARENLSQRCSIMTGWLTCRNSQMHLSSPLPSPSKSSQYFWTRNHILRRRERNRHASMGIST